MEKIIKIILVFIALIIVFPFIIGLPYSPHNKIPENYLGKKVEINGRMMRYYQTGNGEDILFIHGSMGSIEDWEKLYPLLKDRYRVTAIDRPGMGFSDIKDKDYTIEGNVKTAREIIKKLDLKNVIIVGHSRGGAIALRMAKEIPNSKYMKLKSVNHYIQYARPNEVVKALDELSENN